VSPPSLSVLIVNYNGGQAILDCIASVLRHSVPNSEIVVVDNASADGSADAIAARFPEVRLIRSGRNLGFGGGNNLAARDARGKHLVFLNPDTTVEAGWAENLVAPLEEGDSIGLTTAKILLMDPQDRINTCGNAVHVTGLTMCRGMGAPREAFPRREEVPAVSGAAFAMPADLFRRLGGFDEVFFLYMEDTDLSWRARLAGWRCVYEPASIVHHDYSLRISSQKIFFQERNRYLMLVKTLRWRTLVLLLPALLLSEIVTWGFVVLADRAHWSNKLRAYAWVLGHWREILEKRRATQKLRRVPDRAILEQTVFRLDYGQTSAREAGRLAARVFDPLFFVWRKLVLSLVR
jgi:GT2 family glycosyltransferase